MEGTEHPIQRNQTAAVVALEVFVMKVVEVTTTFECPVLANDDSVEAAVRKRRQEGRLLNLKKRIDRMQREQPLHHHRGEIDRMLKRMHGQA